jgi:hypothetical protein
VHLPALADLSAHEAVVSSSWLCSSAILEEALRPPAAV